MILNAIAERLKRQSKDDFKGRHFQAWLIVQAVTWHLRYLHPDPVLCVTRHLQQGIESDHFRVKKNMPKISGFQSFITARRTIAGFEAVLWLRKGFGFAGDWTVNDENGLLERLFGLQKVNKG